jgi:hypothetical protein
MRRAIRTSALPALGAIAVVLAACGSGGSGNVNDTLKSAFSTPVKSANIDLELQLALNGVKQIKGPVKLSVQGPFESGHGKTLPKLNLSIAASASGQNFSAGFISTGDNAFVNFQGQNYELGKQAVAQINQQIQAAAKNKKKGGLSQFGIHARDWLTGAKNEGTSKIDGVDTDHISAGVDVGKMLDDLNTLVQSARSSVGGAGTGMTPQQRQQLTKILGKPRFDVYVGKSDHVLRRLSAHVDFNIPSQSQSQLSGLTGGSLAFSLDLSNVGQPQNITAPANAKPITDLTSKLGGLTGLLGGAAAGGAGSLSTLEQQYTQCLAKANPNSPAAVAKCDALVK